MLADLNANEAPIERLAEAAARDEGQLGELVAGLKSRQETLRYNCFKVLNLLAESNGEVLYPRWDYFVEHLSVDHTYWKLSALQIIAGLTGVDTENRFEKIFDSYYGLLDDRSMIVAAYIASNSGKIARAKPELAPRITARLLSIDETHHAPGRKALVKAGAIKAFGEYFADVVSKPPIIEFVRRQLDSESPKTRKLAGQFLKTWVGDSL
jgi:hypothetical protein